MGIGSSQPQRPYKYSDSEIRQNIDNLFAFNRNNNPELSEASFSIGNLDNIPTETYNEYQDVQTGGTIKFKPSQRRYLRHNINEFVERIQNGGAPDDADGMTEISDMSELDKIRSFIINGQSGGVLSTPFSEMAIQDGGVRHLFSKILNNQYGGDDEDEEDEDEDDEDNEDNEDEDMETDEEEDEDMGTNMDDDMDMETDEDDEKKNPDMSEDGLSSTSSAIVSRIRSLSSTSYSNDSRGYKKKNVTDLNVVPFYSTDSSSVHPYIRKRFD